MFMGNAFLRKITAVLILIVKMERNARTEYAEISAGRSSASQIRLVLMGNVKNHSLFALLMPLTMWFTVHPQDQMRKLAPLLFMFVSQIH